jgi:hypothetical protein
VLTQEEPLRIACAEQVQRAVKRIYFQLDVSLPDCRTSPAREEAVSLDDKGLEQNSTKNRSTESFFSFASK